jgi:hypothetical protein
MASSSPRDCQSVYRGLDRHSTHLSCYYVGDIGIEHVLSQLFRYVSRDIAVLPDSQTDLALVVLAVGNHNNTLPPLGDHADSAWSVTR